MMAIATSIVWSMRFLSGTVVVAGGADVLARMMTPMWWMKIRRYELNMGEKISSVVFGMSHEFLVTLGLLFGLVVSYCLLSFSGGLWALLIAPVLFGVWGSAWVIKDE